MSHCTQAPFLSHSNRSKSHFSPNSTQISDMLSDDSARCSFSFKNYFRKITQKFAAAIYEYLQMAPTSVKDFSYNFNSYNPNSPAPPSPHTHTHTETDTKSEDVYPCSAQSQSWQHLKHRQHKVFATVAAFYYLYTCISQIRTRTHL